MKLTTVFNLTTALCCGIVCACALGLTGIYLANGWNEICERIATVGAVALAILFIAAANRWCQKHFKY